MTKPVQSGREEHFMILYQRSGAAAYEMASRQFAAILTQNLRKYLPQTFSTNPASASQSCSQKESDFCAGLRLEELALARACAAGNERAWQDFISRYRQKLQGMAGHIRGKTAPPTHRAI